MKRKLKSILGILVLVMLLCTVVGITAFAEKAMNEGKSESSFVDGVGAASPSEPEEETTEEETTEEETTEEETTEEETTEEETTEEETTEEETTAEESEEETVPVENRLARVASPSDAFIPVENPAWAVGENSSDGKDYPGWATYNEDQLSEEEKSKVVFVTGRIFKDNVELGWFTDDGWDEDEFPVYINYRMYFNEPGKYTFQAVYGMTDNYDVPEDAWSDMSKPYTYKHIGKSAPIPTNLTWDQDGTMRWDNVQEGKDNYVLRIYKKDDNGNYKPHDFTVTEKNHSSRIEKYKDPDATYKFTVTSEGDLKTCDNSEESPMSKPFYVREMTENADSIIDGIMNSGDVINAVENTVLSEDELAVMKNAIQADPKVAENLKKLEEKYKSETGKNCSITSNSSIVNGNDVTIVGGALNGAESITFDPANVNKDELNTYRKVIGLNISLTGVTGTGALKFPVLVTMPVPSGIYVGKLVIYHYDHDGDLLERITPRNNGDGTISFAVTSFSDFAFVDTTPADTGGGSTGGGGGSSSGGRSSANSNPLEVSGAWSLNEFGWTFARLDGKAIASQWVMNGGNWFHFNETGYMMTGWFTDIDGRKFYLNPVSDGTMGAMKTGWQMVEGKWYYFNPVSDGTRGALLTNTTTPDGFVVNADGVWIQ